MAIQFLRLDPVKFWGLQEAQIIAILVLAAAVPFLVLKTRLVAGMKPTAAEPAGEPETGPEADA